MAKTRSARSRSSRPGGHNYQLWVAALVIIAGVIGTWLISRPATSPPVVEAPVASGPIEFTDMATQARAFMAYNRSIQLNSAQEAVKRQALSHMAAPCCSDYSAYTCCCECNLSRTVWGLSNHLIAQRGYDAEQVSAIVTEWLNFVNPQGFGGNACFDGGCGRPFDKDGCGGMNEAHFVT